MQGHLLSPTQVQFWLMSVLIMELRFFLYLVHLLFQPQYLLVGFQTDIIGEKPQAFLKYAVKKKLGFLTLEYSGHGKSSGKFIRGNITTWSNDVKTAIKKIVKKNNFIIIGSSMGAWISLNQFNYFKKQIKGFIGIGSAPEFLTRLMWNKFPRSFKNEIRIKGLKIIKNGQYEYPISYQLIKLLSKLISSFKWSNK